MEHFALFIKTEARLKITCRQKTTRRQNYKYAKVNPRFSPVPFSSLILPCSSFSSCPGIQWAYETCDIDQSSVSRRGFLCPWLIVCCWCDHASLPGEGDLSETMLCRIFHCDKILREKQSFPNMNPSQTCKHISPMSCWLWGLLSLN